MVEAGSGELQNKQWRMILIGGKLLVTYMSIKHGRHKWYLQWMHSKIEGVMQLIQFMCEREVLEGWISILGVCNRKLNDHIM